MYINKNISQPPKLQRCIKIFGLWKCAISTIPTTCLMFLFYVHMCNSWRDNCPEWGGKLGLVMWIRLGMLSLNNKIEDVMQRQEPCSNWKPTLVAFKMSLRCLYWGSQGFCESTPRERREGERNKDPQKTHKNTKKTQKRIITPTHASCLYRSSEELWEEWSGKNVFPMLCFILKSGNVLNQNTVWWFERNNQKNQQKSTIIWVSVEN